jgi:predicted RNA-binding protein with PUA domain
MKEIDVKGITYLPSYHKMIMSIPDPELRLKAFEAVTNYMMTGEEPECDDWQIKIIMEGVRPVIDKSRRKSKNAQSDDEEETNETNNNMVTNSVIRELEDATVEGNEEQTVVADPNNRSFNSLWRNLGS